MSFGDGGGSGNNGVLMSMLRQDKQRADDRAAKDLALTQEKDAEIENKRVNRLKGGGLQAFTTAGYTGYAPDRMLGGGSSIGPV